MEDVMKIKAFYEDEAIQIAEKLAVLFVLVLSLQHRINLPVAQSIIEDLSLVQNAAGSH